MKRYKLDKTNFYGTLSQCGVKISYKSEDPKVIRGLVERQNVHKLSEQAHKAGMGYLTEVSNLDFAKRFKYVLLNDNVNKALLNNIRGVVHAINKEHAFETMLIDCSGNNSILQTTFFSREVRQVYDNFSRKEKNLISLLVRHGSDIVPHLNSVKVDSDMSTESKIYIRDSLFSSGKDVLIL